MMLEILDPLPGIVLSFASAHMREAEKFSTTRIFQQSSLTIEKDFFIDVLILHRLKPCDPSYYSLFSPQVLYDCFRSKIYLSATNHRLPFLTA